MKLLQIKDPFVLMLVLFMNKPSISDCLKYFVWMMSCQIPRLFIAPQKDFISGACPKILFSRNPQPPNSLGIARSAHLQKWGFVGVPAPLQKKLVTIDDILLAMAFGIMNRCTQKTLICCSATCTNMYLPHPNLSLSYLQIHFQNEKSSYTELNLILSRFPKI